MPDAREPFTNAYSGLRDALGWFFPHASLDTVTNDAYVITRVLNGCIGLIITLAIITLFLYLLRWVFSGTDPVRIRIAAKGAMRSAAALFLMVNIWFVIRLLNKIVDISPLTAYAIFAVSFVIWGAWSVFGIGDSLLRLFAQAASSAINALMRWTRILQNRFPSIGKYVVSLSDTSLKLAIALVIFLVATPVVYIGFTPVGTSEPAAGGAPTPVLYADPLFRGKDDARLARNRYENTRLGISIEYPHDWVVSELPISDPNGLAEARNDGVRVYSRLNAGVFADLATSSREAYLTALWRVEKNIHAQFASSSEGILYAETISMDDIASTSAAVLKFVAYWPSVQGENSVPVYDSYIVFGKGPVYFTLEFETDDLDFAAGQLGETVQEVLSSIKISEPQGTLVPTGTEDGNR